MTAYPISTKAIVASPPKEGLQISWSLQPVRLREPADDELLVRIIATGICHTDLVFSMAPPEVSRYPKILGHEGCGIVEKVGSEIGHVRPGDYVLLSFDFCDTKDCYNCNASLPGYCPQFIPRNIAGYEGVYETEDGVKVAGFFFGQSSFSALALVKKNSAVNVTGLVKDEEELKLFAPFGCGFQTGAGTVTEAVGVKERDAVAIYGLGGVGMLALMAAKIRGAHTIICVDRVQSRLEIAKSIGATHVIDTSNFQDLTEDLTKAVKEIVPGGTNVNFDTTGVIPIIRSSVQSLHPSGQAVLVGVMQGKLDIDLNDLLSFGKTVRGVIEGNAHPKKFLPQLIQWYREGKLPIEKLIKQYPIEEFGRALGEMHTGVTIKPILTW